MFSEYSKYFKPALPSEIKKEILAHDRKVLLEETQIDLMEKQMEKIDFDILMEVDRPISSGCPSTKVYYVL